MANPMGLESSQWDWIHVDEPIPEATWNWSLASRPRCQVMYGNTVVADLADEMPGVGGGTYEVTLSMLANLEPFGLELWRAYPVTLRYSPPFGDQGLWEAAPGGVELVRWYEMSA